MDGEESEPAREALSRRLVLPLLALAPCALAAPSLSGSSLPDGRGEIVIVDGWVLTRYDLRPLG